MCAAANPTLARPPWDRLAAALGACVGAAEAVGLARVDPAGLPAVGVRLGVGVGVAAAIAALVAGAVDARVRRALARSDEATRRAASPVIGAAAAGIVVVAPHVDASVVGAALALAWAGLALGAFVLTRVAFRGIELFPAQARGWRAGVAVGFVALIAATIGLSWRPAASAGRSVLLVTVAGLRRDHVGAFVPGRAQTPALDALAAGGIVFDQAVTPRADAASGAATALTGAHPLRHGLLDDGDRADGVTVAARLAAAGIATTAVIADPALAGRGLEAGFGTFDAGAAPVWARIGAVRLAWGPRRRAPDAAADALVAAWRPGFGWLGLTVAPTADRAAYAAEVAAVDAAIGRVVAGIGDVDVIIVGTGGVMLGEHGIARPGDGLYEELVRVPLIVRRHGMAAGRSDAQARVQDVAPTVLALAGVAGEVPDGVSLLDGDAPRAKGLAAVLVGEVDGAWWLGQRTPRLKVIGPVGGPEAVFHLDTDPWEAIDDAAAPDPAVAEVRAGLAAEAAALSARRPPR